MDFRIPKQYSELVKQMKMILTNAEPMSMIGNGFTNYTSKTINGDSTSFAFNEYEDTHYAYSIYNRTFKSHLHEHNSTYSNR